MSRWDVINKLSRLFDTLTEFGGLSTIYDNTIAIERGQSFNYTKRITENLSAGDSVWITGITQNSEIYLTLRQIRFDKGKCLITTYEDVEFDEEAEAEYEFHPYEMNRNNIKDPKFRIFNSNSAPNVENATIISQFPMLGVQELTGPARSQGNAAFSDDGLPYIYKPNSKYALEIENIDTETIEFLSIYWFWYYK